MQYNYNSSNWQAGGAQPPVPQGYAQGAGQPVYPAEPLQPQPYGLQPVTPQQAPPVTGPGAYQSAHLTPAWAVLENERVQGASKVTGIVSLVLGIVSGPLGLLWGYGSWLSIAAVILGIVSLTTARGRRGKAPAVIGLILGALTLLLYLVLVVVLAFWLGGMLSETWQYM